MELTMSIAVLPVQDPDLGTMGGEVLCRNML
jgi:hypothetical protein